MANNTIDLGLPDLKAEVNAQMGLEPEFADLVSGRQYINQRDLNAYRSNQANRDFMMNYLNYDNQRQAWVDDAQKAQMMNHLQFLVPNTSQPTPVTAKPTPTKPKSAKRRTSNALSPSMQQRQAELQAAIAQEQAGVVNIPSPVAYPTVQVPDISPGGTSLGVSPQSASAQLAQQRMQNLVTNNDLTSYWANQVAKQNEINKLSGQAYWDAMG